MKNRFQIIAYRSVTPQGVTADYELDKKIRSMQKKTYGRGWYYFYDGYSIEEDNTLTLRMDESKNPVTLYDIPNGPTISLSAIVGENGSGKSALTEMLIRVLNNLSVAAFGEEKTQETASHLHFIENVYGELVLFIGGKYKWICIGGRSVKVGTFEEGRRGKYVCKCLQEILTQSEQIDKAKAIKAKEANVIKLGDWFYTAIFNYSLYALNFHDYKDECTTEKRWENYEYNPDSIKYDNVWLSGLFHKNDGYKVPIVISPMRENGQISANKENHLAKERQLSLLVYKKAGEKDEYPLRTINKNKRIVSLLIRPITWTTDSVLDELALTKADFACNLLNVMCALQSSWRTLYNIDRNTSWQLKEAESVWAYILYKTLKISKSYPRYKGIFEYLKSQQVNGPQLEEMLLEMFSDGSHVTAKLRRALCYLKYGLYESFDEKIELTDLDKKMSEVLGDEDRQILEYKGHKCQIDRRDLLPPPCFDIDYLLLDIQDEKETPFLFSGLSSGEKQVSYTLSHVLYHLVNINSVWDAYDIDRLAANQIKGKRVRYKNLFVIFDEVELYYHPDLQRRYVDYLLDAIRNAELGHVESIHILLITHSPFILSDIPAQNVLCLGAEKVEKLKPTFAANVNELLAQPFFMKGGFMGEFAKNKLRSLIAYLKGEKTKETWTNESAREIIDMIGDEVLRRQLSILQARKEGDSYKNWIDKEYKRLHPNA